MLQYVADGEKIVAVKANMRPQTTTMVVCVHARAGTLRSVEGAAIRRGMELLGEIFADSCSK